MSGYVCVRTGLTFHLLADDSYRTGDLFYYPGFDLFQIRGIPKGTEARMKTDVTVMNCYMCQRDDSPYADTNIGVTIITPSPEFAAHIRQWYPDLVNRIPGVKNGETA